MRAGAVYLAFRYRKLGRRTPQSSWVVDGRVKGVGSVEEYVCVAAKAVADCDGVKFAASGREDWDVRMLGNGRPAYAELQNCRKWSTQDVVGAFAREVAKASNGVVEAIHVGNRGQGQGRRRQRERGNKSEDLCVRRVVFGGSVG